MKKNIVVFGLCVLALLAGCGSTGSTGGGQPQTQQAQQQTVQNWTGDGGSGMSISILAPQTTGLAANQAYLPALVQGEFVSNFSGFSAISVLDRMRLDEQYAELLSGYYSDDAEAGMDLGHLTPTTHIMGGSITRTAAGFVLQMHITKSSDKTTVASHSGTITFAELDNLSGIRRASLDLLEKMGVTLTAQAQEQLSGAAAANHVNAQTALARGIVAQRGGNTIETMARFYEAASYDPSLAEAVARANTMSASIRTGSIGENIRNDIAWRDEWVKILTDAAAFLRANPPVIATVIYDANLTQENINYQSRTADFSFDIEVNGLNYPQAYVKMIEDINAGLEATGRNGDWRLSRLDPQNIWDERGRVGISFRADLLNDTGRIIASTNSATTSITSIRGTRGSEIDNLGEISFHRVRTIRSNDTLFNHIRPEYEYPLRATFRVNAGDISDRMTIRLTATARNMRGGGNFPVQVMTKAEYDAQFEAQLRANGLPNMGYGTIRLFNITGLGNRRQINAASVRTLTAERAFSSEESRLGLAFRPALKDGEVLIIDANRLPVVNGQRVIDTSNYRFPVSAAVLLAPGGGNYIIQGIINIRPGQQAPLSGFGSSYREQTMRGWGAGADAGLILIVPEGWFQRNNFKRGTYVPDL